MTQARFDTCAVRTTATIQCWGLNSTGQLGIGNTTSFSTPQAVSGTGWARVSAALTRRAP
ncbi:MAG: RCC1 domain-containing protein [Ilumatobacteraceae bacterium]